MRPLCCYLLPASATFSAFGVFDGHGGKQSAVYASKHLLPTLADFIDRAAAPGPQQQPAAAAGAAAAGEGEGEVASAVDKEIWAAQEALVERLPQVSIGRGVGFEV